MPTVRAELAKRGTLSHLVEPLAHYLPVIEVIVAGKPDEEFMAESLPADVRLEVIELNNTERCVLRNAASSLASGTHLLLLDDDTIVLPTERLRNKFYALQVGSLLTLAKRCYLGMHQDFDRIYGLLRENGWDVSAVSDVVRAEDSWRERELYGTEITFASNFGILDKQTFRSIGGFDEDMTGWGYEDVDLMNRVLCIGEIVISREYATAIHIDHEVIPNREEQAFANYNRFVEKCRNNVLLAPFSSPFYSIVSRYYDKVERYRPLTLSELHKRLGYIGHFKTDDTDRDYVARYLLAALDCMDVMGIAIYGSAADGGVHDDIDMCAIVGQGKERFEVIVLPSGTRLELQIVTLHSIRGQIAGIPYMGHQGFMTYGKWKSLNFLLEYKTICREHIETCFKSCGYVVPFLYSYSVGCVWLSLRKSSKIARLEAEIATSALASLSGNEGVNSIRLDDSSQARTALETICEGLRRQYVATTNGMQREKYLVYPPNFIGDALLRGATRSNVLSDRRFPTSG